MTTSLDDDPPRLHAHGFSAWKRPLLRRFFPASTVVFVDRGEAVPAGAVLAVWGCAPPPPGLPGDVALLRVEDGFLRSVGLGADLVPPLSWVADRRGLHLDATRPSDLEHLLESGTFDDRLVARAAALRGRIVDARLTKYNLAGRDWRPPSTTRPVVLVVGQVEDDASVRHGSPDLRTNAALLAAARSERPDAWIVYKPHPDVTAGLRRRGAGESAAAGRCDAVVDDVPLPVLLDRVDEVHTLTSLAGFEALLRGVRVRCHGLPFYAGWGLTDDRLHLARRTRRRSVDELACAALLLYPRYASRDGARRLSPEAALDELLAWRAGDRGLPAWRRMLRPVLARTAAARRA